MITNVLPPFCIYVIYICRMLSKEDKILIKILRQEKRYGMKNCLQNSPINIGHSQASAVSTGTVIKQVNLTVEENAKLFEQNTV